jgi:ABC-type uncharacterized transport system involved in gliding motility auxiliary subunit
MLNRIASVIGWLGTVLVFGSVGVRLFKPEWNQYAYYGAWAGLACVLLYMAAQWRDIADSFSKRQARMGSILGLTVIVVLALLVGVNYLSSRRNKRWDLTANQQFSLSDQTKQILQKLDAPLKVRVFDKPSEFDRFRERLNEYAYISKQLAIDYIDVDRQPLLANQNLVQQYGTVVFEYKGRTERVTSSDEQQLTNGLIKLVTGKQRKLYFLKGHGERDSAGTDRRGYGTIVSGLQSDNFATDSLLLLEQNAVPADASVVVIAGPTADLLPQEIDALRKYLDAGGKLAAFVDPPVKTGDTTFPNLTALLHDWAIDLGHAIVETKGVRLSGTDESVAIAAPPYPSHAITENFALLTAFPLAQSVTPVSGGVNGRTAQPFIQTTALAVQGPDGSRSGAASAVPIAAALSVTAPSAPAAPLESKPEAAPKSEAPPKPETRVAVIGDSDFASNALLGVEGNRDMFLNTMNWLSQQESLISIRPKDPEDRRLTLTASEQVAVRWLALLVVPGLIWGAGIYNWSRRRG